MPPGHPRLRVLPSQPLGAPPPGAANLAQALPTRDDPSMAVTAQPTPAVRIGTPQGKWILLTTVLGSSMALLDSTVVNVALPRIGHALDTSLAALQWTVNA